MSNVLLYIIMSELLKDRSNNQIKSKAIALIQSIFNTKQIPSEFTISEFTIILKFKECAIDEPLDFYSNDGIEFTYLKNKSGDLCIVNILTPEVIFQKEEPIIDPI